MSYSFGVKLIIFLVLNFVVLGAGAFLQGAGPSGDWYQNLNKAPWTPPGWVFGAAWTTIMILLAFYMASITGSKVKIVYTLYFVQLALNLSWNPLFFMYQEMVIALIVLVLLAVMVLSMGIISYGQLNWKVLFILPYFIWLCIATSLNAYVLLNN